jgi:hypothetical protein
MRPLISPLLIVLACLVAPAVSVASDADSTPWLRRIPDVAEALPRLPPFLRDTDLRLHARSAYLNTRGSDDAISEAWAGGGWLSYRSGWLLDTFQMGATVFTSFPLYAPADRDGTRLLEPGQRGFVVPGVAFGALRYEEYALLTGYRQLVHQTYVNPHDNRMAPVTFEGVTLGGTVGFADYLVGYLTGMKERDRDDFVSMVEGTGVVGHDGGLVLAGARLAPVRGLTLELSNQRTQDVFNTAFAQIDYIHAITTDLAVTLSGQYTDQRAVGAALLGGSKFKHWVTSVGAARVRLHYRDLTLGAAVSVTAKGHDIVTPYGEYPGFLHVLIKDFNRAGEVAWRTDIGYDLSRVLPGTHIAFAFAQGTNAINAVRRTPAPDEREYKVALDVRAPKASALRGVTFRSAAGLVDVQGARKPQYQIRLYLDYELPLL